MSKRSPSACASDWKRSRRYPGVIAEIRGLGLLLGLKCVVENKAMMVALRAHGLLSGPAGQNVVRLLPPLIITDKHIEEAIVAIEAACRDLASGGGRERPAA